MDIRFLESFAQVAQYGSFAEAARRLGLTPAAIAQRIKSLEADVGAALVVRSGRTVRPTPAGERILAHAQELIRDAQELRTMAASEEIAGELRLGAVLTAITGLLPDVLSRFVGLHPKLKISVVPGVSTELYRQVIDGELDAALIVEPPFALPKTCDWRVVHTEPMVLIAPEKMRGRDARDLLTNEPFIRYDRKHWGGRLADDCLRAAKVQPRELFELDALGAIAVLVSRELGVSLVPDWAPPWPSGLRLIKLKPPGPAVSRKIGLVWSRTSPRGRLVQTFLQEMKLAMRGADLAKGSSASANEPRRKTKR